VTDFWFGLFIHPASHWCSIGHVNTDYS